jgi:RNA polymerase-binding transcription factor DksA
MASKKKTNKKAAKPAKKVVKKAAKPAKKAAKPAKKVVKKPVAKKAAKPAKKVVAKKPVKKVVAKKPVKKVVAKKPAKKVVAKPAKPVKKVAPVKVAKVKVVKPAKVKVEKPVKVKIEKPAKVEKIAVVKPAKPAKPARPDKRHGRPQYESMMRKTVDVKSLPKPPVPVGKPTSMFYSHYKAGDHTKAAKIDDRTRYNEEELKEFKEIILRKLAEARKDLDMLRSSLTHTSDNGTDDTSPTFKMMEDGSETLSREETAQLAGRQEKFIQALEAALIRIENKTYGVCRVTGRLINKERLKLVPHTTLSIEAKNMQN